VPAVYLRATPYSFQNPEFITLSFYLFLNFFFLPSLLPHFLTSFLPSFLPPVDVTYILEDIKTAQFNSHWTRRSKDDWFLNYLMTLFQQYMLCSIEWYDECHWWMANNLKEVVAATCFKGLFQHFPGITEGNHENPQWAWPVSGNAFCKSTEDLRFDCIHLALCSKLLSREVWSFASELVLQTC